VVLEGLVVITKAIGTARGRSKGTCTSNKKNGDGSNKRSVKENAELVADKGESEKVCGGRRDSAISDDI
jgi:hypothetical protein